MKRFSIDIQRSHVVMANAIIKTIKHPAAAVLSKVTARLDAFLEEYPGDKYRLTAECIENEKPREDRESEEERAEPAGSHYR